MRKHIFDSDGEYQGVYSNDLILDETYQIVELEMKDGSFYRPVLREGEIVEGLTPEEIDELNKPIEQEPSPEERIAQLEQENKLLKAQNNTLTERTDFHEEVLTEIILTITP